MVISSCSYAGKPTKKSAAKSHLAIIAEMTKKAEERGRGVCYCEIPIAWRQ